MNEKVKDCMVIHTYIYIYKYIHSCKVIMVNNIVCITCQVYHVCVITTQLLVKGIQ